MTLTANQHHFTASDGVELSYLTWSREGAPETEVLILILHGIGFHASPYLIVAKNIRIPNAAFAALDFRGHGSSGGTRGEMAAHQRMIKDIAEWVEHMQALFPGAPTFLIAESMAGPYAALYALANSDRLRGLILLSPAVLVSWRQIIHPDSLKPLQQLFVSPSSPSVALTGSRLQAASRDASVFVERSGDGQRLHTVSPRYILRIGGVMARLVMRQNMSTDTSILVIHGDKDSIVSPLGSRLLTRRIQSPDKSLVIMPGAYHTLIWDDDTGPAAFAIMGAWISQRLQKPLL